MTLGAEVLVVTDDGGTDDFGDPLPAAPPRTYEGCAVYPRGPSTERSGREQTVLEGYTALIPPQEGAVPDVKPNSRVQWRGKAMSVVGEVGLWPHLDGELAGVQVNLAGATS